MCILDFITSGEEPQDSFTNAVSVQSCHLDEGKITLEIPQPKEKIFVELLL